MCYNFFNKGEFMRRITVFLLLAVLAGCGSLQTSAEYVSRGNGYLADAKPERAVAMFDKALVLNPNNAEAYEGRGVAYFTQDAYTDAAADFIEAIRLNPYNSNAYTAYASAAAASGDYVSALKALEVAAQVNPNKPEIYFSRGNIYYLLGRYDLAAQDFTALLEAYPSADVLSARGAALLKLGYPDLAQRDFAAARSGTYPAQLSEYALVK